MLITFKTPAHANVTMFGVVALNLLKLMGRSQTVPSAMWPADIPQALENLRQGLAAAAMKESEASGDDEEKEPSVSIKHRALPLIELLEAAHSADVSVMWEEGDG